MMRSIAALVVCLFATACGGTQKGSVNWRVAQNAYTMGNYAGAAERAEKELAASSEANRQVAAIALSIKSLGKLAQYEEKPTQYDDKAGRLYQQGLRVSGASEAARAELEIALASFMRSTSRLRKGLPHMRSALAAANKSGDAAVKIRALHGMAQMFAQMGELETAQEYLENATSVGEAAIGSKERVEASDQVSAYIDFLDWRLDHALRGPGAREAVGKIWTSLDRGLSAYWTASDKFKLSAVARESRLARRSIITMRAAASFAEVGEEAQARLLYERVLTDLNVWGGSAAIGPLENRLACTRARVDFALGELDRAKSFADACVAGAITPRDKAMLQQRVLSLLANIRERSGDAAGAAELYTKEIKRYERIRQAIPVEERTTFFRGAARVAWEGLVRSRARLFRATGSRSALAQLLAAGDGMRARQLGELAGGVPTGTVSLSDLRAALPPKAAVVSVMFAGSEVVVVAITGTTARAEVIPIEPAALEQQLAAVTQRVGAKQDPAGLRVDLARLGQTILGPVSADLRHARRITVVADGGLNAFPVELLSVDGTPLHAWATVALAPSLRFFLRDTKRDVADRLYAFGDPAYKAPPAKLGYMTDKETKSLQTRGSPLLAAFSPLPETRSEVNAIAGLFDGRADVALGAQASESTLQAKPPSNHRYVHFATHGILAGQLQGLGEPALVLSNESASDGFLTASEVSKMKLSADLSVLSACSTGAGATLPGEG